MSDYQDLWIKKMQNNGGNVSNSLLSHSKRMYSNAFKDDPSYKGAILKKSDLTEITIDTRIINVDKTTKEKRIQVLPDNVVDMGDYIVYPDKTTYLVEEFEDNAVVPYCKVTQCNQMFVMYDSTNTRHEFPCIVSNDSYGSKSIADNDYITNEDSKASIVIQSNVYTRQIPKNYRVMFCNSKEGIYKIFSINVAIKDGIIDFIGKKDLYLSGLDNLENNTAYQYSYMDSEEEESIDYPLNKLCGDDNIIIGNQSQYVYITSNNERVSWSLDNTVCTMAQQGSNYCTLEALKADNVCVLTARINNVVVGEKFITTSRY